MIHMQKEHFEIIMRILKKYPYTFYAFGSRARGTHRSLSDLDICFMEPIPFNVQSHIREDFEESNLPFTVDLVDWNSCSDEFKKRIVENRVLLQSTI